MADLIFEIRERRILPSVGVYAGSCWVLVEIIDRLVERYLLSPYVTDIVFWGLYSLIPAVILIAWTHGRPGKDEITTLEKVGVPINLIATMGLLLTVFGDKNLGAAADLVTINNEDGQQESHYVAKEAFRRRVAVFFFENTSGNHEMDWLQYGITDLLVQDLNESAFINTASPWTNNAGGFYSRMREAGFEDGLSLPRSLMREIADNANRQYFIDGTVGREGDEYILSASVWDTRTVSEVASLSERGWDLYDTADKLSEAIHAALEVPQGDGRLAGNLPLGEIYGESLEAFRLYIEARNARLFENDIDRSTDLFQQSVEIDPGFVRSWFSQTFNHLNSGDLPSAQAALEKVREFDYRLPSSDRATAKQLNYRLTGQVDKQVAFLKMQVQLRNDAQAHVDLAQTLMATGQLSESKQQYLAALELDPLNLDIYLQLANLEKGIGNMPNAISFTNEYLERKPEDVQARIRLGDLLRDNGDLDAAEEQYRQASLLEDQAVTSTLKLSLLAMRRGDEPAARGLIEEAEQQARSAQQKSQVRTTAEYLESRLGRMNAAIEQLYAREVYLQELMSPFQVALSIYSPMIQYYSDLGDTARAREALDKALAATQPPLDQLLAFGEAVILAEEGKLDEAEQAVDRGLEIIERFKLEELKLQADYLRGLIEFERGEYDTSVKSLVAASERIEHSVLIGSDVNLILPQIYGLTARSQVYAGDLDAASKTLEHAFELDSASPTLWLAKARLQHVSGMQSLAMASVNYALAIWSNADPEFRYFQDARDLAQEIEAAL
ncbi:MAG: tetratricopeptide repeat protein [Xanthomonadales bacterium]|nr:tetratricopeptide repeat protein [Xanthomonadales bacterium]